MPCFKKGEADRVLDAYQRDYGQDHLLPITASDQGEPPSSIIIDYPSRQQLCSASNIKPRANANFRVKDLTLDEVILVLIHPTTVGFFSAACIKSISLLDRGYSNLLSEARRLGSLDFSSLCEPRFDYASQIAISNHRVDLLSACFMHYKGDTGLFIRFLGHEYTGIHRDVPVILRRIKPHIEAADYDAIKRMLKYRKLIR